MKMKRLVLCMMLSLALIVTFIPVISFAQDEENIDQVFEEDYDPGVEENNDQVVEEDVQANDFEEPNEENSSETKHLLDNPVSDDRKAQLEEAFANQQFVLGSSYTDPVYDNAGKIKLYYPEPSGTYYLGREMRVAFKVYDTWTSYYTMPVYGVWDANGNYVEAFAGEIANADQWTEYTDSIYLNPSKYHLGTYIFMIFNVPCDSSGKEVDGWDQWSNVPYTYIRFNATCTHSWRQAVQDAAGYLKNGIGCDQCAICGAIVNSRTIPGWSTKYVKSAKAKKGKKSLTVKWKKQSKKNQKKFDGYEIRYSTDGNIYTAKAITVSKKAKSKKIGKLAKKTKYYVWISSYKNVNGVRNYSNWSWGTVKTK